jgi:hypothetical protein
MIGFTRIFVFASSGYLAYGGLLPLAFRFQFL